MNVNQILKRVLFSFSLSTTLLILITLLFPHHLFAQTSGSSSTKQNVSGSISDKSGNPLFSALLTLYGAGGQVTTQRSNSAGGFAFTLSSGKYSLYGSSNGYQSNVCSITVDKNPIKVTFVLAVLGTGGSSCTATVDTSSSDQTSGGADVGNSTTAQSSQNGNSQSIGDQSGVTSGTADVGPVIKTTSNCAITAVGDPKDESDIPANCSSAGGPGVGGPGGTCQVVTTRPANVQGSLQSELGITFQSGFSNQQLMWIYEEFQAIRQTGFLPLVKRAVIAPTYRDDLVSWQESCPEGQINGGPAPDVYFNVNLNEVGTKTLIIHELTHAIQNCLPNGISNRSEIPAIYADEGGLTHYSATAETPSACFSGIDRYNEDHAETIAFHLNPFSPEQTCAAGGNPYSGGAHPLHKQLAIKLVGNYACNQQQ